MRFVLHTFLTSVGFGLAILARQTSVPAQDLRQPLSVLPTPSSVPQDTRYTPPAAEHYPQWLMDMSQATPETDLDDEAIQKNLKTAKPLVNVEADDYEILGRIRARDINRGDTGPTPKRPVIDPSTGGIDGFPSLPFLRAVRERVTNRRSARQ